MRGRGGVEYFYENKMGKCLIINFKQQMNCPKWVNCPFSRPSITNSGEEEKLDCQNWIHCIDISPLFYYILVAALLARSSVLED